MTSDHRVSAEAPSVGGVRSLHVLHVFSFFRPDFTGEGIYLEKLAVELHRLGIASDVIVSRTRSAPRFSRDGAIGAVRFFGTADKRQRLLNPAMLWWFVVNARRYGIVHFHGAVDRLFLFHLLAKLFGCRIVHGCTLDDDLGSLVQSYSRRHRPFVRFLCRLIDSTVAISPKLYLGSLAVLPSKHVRLIPQGVTLPTIDVTKRAALRAQWGFNDQDIVLLFVGSLCRRKNPKFLVENHLLVEVVGARVRLVLLGPDLEDDYADSVRRMVAASPCRQDITLHGYMEDPTPVYKMADIFVFASDQEGFGNVLLEAMAASLPVVTRKLLGVTDSIVVHGGSGLLFDDAASYAEAVRKLALDPVLRRAMGARAREAVIRKYDLRNIANCYAELYRGLVLRRTDA